LGVCSRDYRGDTTVFGPKVKKGAGRVLERLNPRRGRSDQAEQFGTPRSGDKDVLTRKKTLGRQMKKFCSQVFNGVGARRKGNWDLSVGMRKE